LPVPAGWSKVAGPISNSETTVHQPQAARPRNPWLWIPSLNFCSGVPYFVVIWLSVMMYKSLGVSNTDAALYTSWLYLPWVIKPLWSPLVEMFRTKRFWILAAQLLIGVSFGLVALAVPTTHFMRISLAALWLVAFSSATHDIAADGFYMLAQNEKDQAAFVGVRSTFYRISGLAAQAGLLFLSGVLTDYTGSATNAWHYVFLLLAVFFAAAALYHQFLLPRPADDHATVAEADPLKGYFSTLAAFFKKPDIGVTLAFLLLFRLGEAQALKLVGPFLLDPREKGGLALSPQTISWAYAGVGIDRAHHRRPAGRLADFAPWPEEAAVAAGAGYPPAEPRLRAAGVPAAAESVRRRLRAGRRAVRLRLRLHRVHDVHDDGLARPAEDRALFDLHRLHGRRHDAARRGQRLDPGPCRLPAFLHLGLHRHAAGPVPDRAPEDRSGIRQAGDRVTAQGPTRLASLDAFRGFTIAAMVLVNNPGDWSHLYGPLEHAKWNGWTFTDCIFPFFLFIGGVAMALSLGRLAAAGADKAAPAAPSWRNAPR
jgi:hypothetical protein